MYEGGTTNASQTIFESSDPEDLMLHFPQGRTYQFRHGLGTTPTAVNIYVSFCEQLTKCGSADSKTNPNNVSLAAGNEALIEVWNEDMIQIRNDTCENNFYVRVVAIADPDAERSDGGASGAGGVDGVND